MPSRWANTPYAPAALPFFYGWVILGVAILATLSSTPGQTMGMGVFTDDLIETLGFSRTRLSMLYALGTIASGFFLPYAGRLLDRVGARAMGVAASIMLAASLVGLTLADRVGFPGVAGAYFTMGYVLLCFMLLRFSGQGCLTMVGRVLIGQWFNRRRGLATAISGIFVSFGFSVAPLPLNWMVETLGWRGACLALAAAIGLGMSAVSAVAGRDNPEDCGLEMDGGPAKPDKDGVITPMRAAPRDYTGGEAMRTWVFWVFNMAVASQALVVTGLTFNIASIGAESGLERAQAYALFWPMAIFSIVANFAGGWASDRYRLKWLLILMMASQAMGTIGLMQLGDLPGRAMFTVGYGVSGGLFSVLVTVTWPHYFGRRHLGAISGLNMSIMVFASAIGPVLFSMLHDLAGDYRAVFIICAAMPLLVLVAGFWADRPRDEEQRDTGADA